MTFKKTITTLSFLSLLMGSTSAMAQDVRDADYSFYLGEAIEIVDGLASNTILDNLTRTPDRVSDTRSSTSGKVRGVLGLSSDSTLDFGYDLALTSYFDEGAFNFMNNTVGVGYTRRIDESNTASIRADASRSFANTSYTPYYWSAHTAIAWAHTHSNQFSVVYGFDAYRYVFDDSTPLNSTQTQFSITPSYTFSDIPAAASVILRVSNSNADANTNGYESIDVIPSVSYSFPNSSFIEASGQISKSDFDAPDIFQSTVTREDSLYRASVNYYMPLMDTPQTGNMLVYTGYGFTRNDSNIDRQDYDSEVISFGFTTRF